MNSYQRFIFKHFNFDPTSKQLTCTYSFDNELTFTEVYHFNFDFVDYDPTQLERACLHLFIMAGVSYFKAYLPPEIVFENDQLDTSTADFFSKTYQRGLGEFFYVNQLDPRQPVTIPAAAATQAPISTPVTAGLLIGLGGGKDSLVSVELLRDLPNTATWSLNHDAQLQPLVAQVGLPHYSVQRDWDKSLLEHNAQGALNGHVPISAIFACVGTIVGILTGHAGAVVSNEHSANEPTLQYQGVAINHQYSKSLEFETDYQALLAHAFGDSLGYFSFLRPLSELQIAELFVHRAFDCYKSVFSSCNRAFVHSSNTMSWCGECSKCAFVFLILTPFLDRHELEHIWGGKNLLLDPELEATYRQILGIDANKPLDCVGEIAESRAAMRMAQQEYPELAKYEFELTEGYDYRALAGNTMPTEIYDRLLAALRN